ncbi:hypothetical protein, partial [Streptosporangium nondiastaticum]|uniref:hypothetical protein n=1 Tax=Streptosporangium nondiastaticum TaxID=35764 RepID=UPI0031F806A2
MRDALMHGNRSACRTATLLPTAIERVHAGGAALAAAGELRYCATERSREGDTYVYDIAVRTPARRRRGALGRPAAAGRTEEGRTRPLGGAAARLLPGAD